MLCDIIIKSIRRVSKNNVHGQLAELVEGARLEIV